MFRAATFVWGTLAVCCMGCGGGSELELRAVSGVLKADSGNPIAEAKVFFMPEDGSIASSATTAEDGSFTLRTSTGASGAVVGKHKVTVTKNAADEKVNWNDPSSMADLAASRNGGGSRRQGSEPKGTREQGDGSIPKKYASANDTPLSYDVTSGGDHGAIELTVVLE